MSSGTLRYHWVNTIGHMMKNMSVRAGFNPPFTNHCITSTTVNSLSSRNMKNRHIRAVTGHESDANLESSNDRPTLEQFQDMSSAITELVNLSKPQVALRPVLAPVNSAGSAAGLSAFHRYTDSPHPVLNAVLRTWYNFWWVLRQLLFQLSFQVNFD